MAVNAAFAAESGALAVAGGDATAAPMYWADALTAATLSNPAIRKRQRILAIDRMFINSP
jgi:hypothetical protein